MNNPIVPWWKTDLGEDEIRGVERSIRDRHINQGPVCKELEAKLAGILGVEHIALTTSGSMALALSLIASGVKSGDEVIIPAISFIATAHAVLFVGGKVKLVDVCEDKPLIDPEKIEAAITDKTKAVIAVHLNGAACDIEAIKTIAKKYDLKVIEDSAQALGSKNSAGYLGTQSDFGTFSMSIAKLITTGEGGFVATNNQNAYTSILKLRNQGVLSVPDNIFDGFGFNCRFNDMLAGIGIVQAEKLDQKIASVKRIYNFYKENLSDLSYLKVMDAEIEGGQVPLWTQAICAERDKVIKLLEAHGIQARPFNPPLNESKHLGNSGNFPLAKKFAQNGITLPCGPDQTQENLDRSVLALHKIAGEISTSVEKIF